VTGAKGARLRHHTILERRYRCFIAWAFKVAVASSSLNRSSLNLEQKKSVCRFFVSGFSPKNEFTLVNLCCGDPTLGITTLSVMTLNFTFNILAFRLAKLTKRSIKHIDNQDYKTQTLSIMTISLTKHNKLTLSILTLNVTLIILTFRLTKLIKMAIKHATPSIMTFIVTKHSKMTPSILTIRLSIATFSITESQVVICIT
jgi:hypothetical protein